MLYSTLIFLTSFILLSGLANPSDKDLSGKPCQYEVKKFSGYKAAVIIKSGEIKCYDAIDLDINHLAPSDREYVEKYMPDWRGENYTVSLFKWERNNFYLKHHYYSNDSAEANVREEDFKDVTKIDLHLPDKYSKVQVISNLLTSALVVAYAEGDFNSDQKRDLVLVYRDTSVIKTWIDANTQDDCHLVIFEAIETGAFKPCYANAFSSWMLDIGKLEIEDINKDGNEDVILWQLSRGASGWSEIVEIFFRKRNK